MYSKEIKSKYEREILNDFADCFLTFVVYFGDGTEDSQRTSLTALAVSVNKQLIPTFSDFPANV